METKAHHALVGFFVVFLTAAGVFFFLWLSQAAFDRDFREYDAVFEGPVRGLRVASEVRFNGIQVGEVTDLGLNPDNPGQVIARIRIDAATPVQVDSYAQLEPQGLTGLSYIQINSGEPDSPRLEGRLGDRAPRIYARQAQLDGLFAGGETLLESAQLTFARFGLLLSDENIESLSKTLANLETISAAFAEDDSLLQDARAAVRSFDEASQAITLAAAQFSEFGVTAQEFLETDVTQMVADVSSASVEVDRASQETYDMLVSMRPALDRFSAEGLDEMTEAIRDLRSLLAAMERISLEIEEDPAGFISRRAGEEVEVPR